MVTYLNAYPRIWSETPRLEHVKTREVKRRWIEHTFVHPNVMFMLEGGGVVRSGGAEWRMGGPFVLLTRPGRRYAYGPDTTWVEQALCYDELAMPAAMEVFPEEPWEMREPALVADLLDRMDELLRHPANPGVADQVDLLGRMAVLTSLHGVGADMAEGPRKRLYAAEAWLRANFRKPVEMGAVARRFGFSQPTFRRQWREVFNVSPWQYVMELRIREARRLLRANPEKTIAEVGWDCGFSDQRHFATVYRRRLGRSPRDERATPGEAS